MRYLAIRTVAIRWDVNSTEEHSTNPCGRRDCWAPPEDLKLAIRNRVTKISAGKIYKIYVWSMFDLCLIYEAGSLWFNFLSKSPSQFVVPPFRLLLWLIEQSNDPHLHLSKPSLSHRKSPVGLQPDQKPPTETPLSWKIGSGRRRLEVFEFRTKHRTYLKKWSSKVLDMHGRHNQTRSIVAFSLHFVAQSMLKPSIDPWPGAPDCDTRPKTDLESPHILWARFKKPTRSLNRFQQTTDSFERWNHMGHGWAGECWWKDTHHSARRLHCWDSASPNLSRRSEQNPLVFNKTKTGKTQNPFQNRQNSGKPLLVYKFRVHLELPNISRHFDNTPSQFNSTELGSNEFWTRLPMVDCVASPKVCGLWYPAILTRLSIPEFICQVHPGSSSDVSFGRMLVD